MAFNQRSVAEILQMIRVVGALVGCPARADALADRLEMDLDSIAPRRQRSRDGRASTSRSGTSR